MRLKCYVVREELEHSKEICNRTVLDLFSKGHLVSRLGGVPWRESAWTRVLRVSPERVRADMGPMCVPRESPAAKPHVAER